MSGVSGAIAREIAQAAAPDLSVHHAVASVRVGTRAGMRLLRSGLASPAMAAAGLWLGWAHLNRVGMSWYPFPTPVAAWWLRLGAEIATLVVFARIVVGLLETTPTHRYENGRWKPIRHVPWKANGPGYAQVKPAKQHLSREVRRAKKDVARTQKTLARVGARRREHWARQHAAEDSVNAERTKPGFIDRQVMEIKPKPKRRKAGATSPGQKRKQRGRQHRQQLDQDYEATAARLAVARLTRTGAARPRLDPDAGPPVAPGAEPTPMADRQRDRIDEINARVDAEVADQKERAAAHVAALIDRNPNLAAQINAAVADVARREWEANGHDTYTPPPAPRLTKSTTGADQ